MVYISKNYMESYRRKADNAVWIIPIIHSWTFIHSDFRFLHHVSNWASVITKRFQLVWQTTDASTLLEQVWISNMGQTRIAPVKDLSAVHCVILFCSFGGFFLVLSSSYCIISSGTRVHTSLSQLGKPRDQFWVYKKKHFFFLFWKSSANEGVKKQMCHRL